ncbi:MAG: YlxR family protein [Actinomycetota bacterium]|nr:YlxR family protein [Actinomycetota bacterium]
MRVNRVADGALVVDRHAPGRGAWLCRAVDNSAVDNSAIQTSCLALAERRQGFDRTFRVPVGASSIMALRDSHAEREKMVLTSPPARRRRRD